MQVVFLDIMGGFLMDANSAVKPIAFCLLDLKHKEACRDAKDELWWNENLSKATVVKSKSRASHFSMKVFDSICLLPRQWMDTSGHHDSGWLLRDTRGYLKLLIDTSKGGQELDRIIAWAVLNSRKDCISFVVRLLARLSSLWTKHQLETWNP